MRLERCPGQLRRSLQQQVWTRHACDLCRRGNGLKLTHTALANESIRCPSNVEKRACELCRVSRCIERSERAHPSREDTHGHTSERGSKRAQERFSGGSAEEPMAKDYVRHR